MKHRKYILLFIGRAAGLSAAYLGLVKGDVFMYHLNSCLNYPVSHPRIVHIMPSMY